MELLIITSWIIFSGVIAALAKQKGKNPASYFFLSLFLSPLIGAIAVMAAPVDSAELDRRSLERGESKKCPYCFEYIKYEATVCKHCHREIPVQERYQPSQVQTDIHKSTWEKKIWIVVVIVALIFVIVNLMN